MRIALKEARGGGSPDTGQPESKMGISKILNFFSYPKFSYPKFSYPKFSSMHCLKKTRT